MPRYKTPIALTVLLLMVVTLAVSPVWAQQEGAASAISSAKNTILTSYNEARGAEAAGANITSLTATLNQAGSLLSQSEFAYATGDFGAASNLASQSQTVLSSFIGEANALTEAAVQQQNQEFLVLVGSIIGTFVVVVVGGLVWLFLRRKSEKTEATASESPRV